MLYSKMFIPTLKEAPADADTISAKYMIRAGMIRKVSSGLYEYLPLGFRVLKKVEKIIREELDAIGGQEISMPLILPKELWEETGRWKIYGKELFRLKDRKEADFCLSPTHEEPITDLARREIRSYRQLPVMFYQFGAKFRDEIRPRFGVMRAREFLMKDAYSFHADEQDLENYYSVIFEAYNRICKRCGFVFRPVEAASGAIGGSFSHEFMVLADTGEEEIAWCPCGYGANSEKAQCLPCENTKEALEPLQEISTPDIKTIDEVSGFLKIDAAKTIKSIFYLADAEPILVLTRGDTEINETKLASALNADGLVLLEENAVYKIAGAHFGSLGPINLKQKIKIIADLSIDGISNAAVGANKDGFHLKGANYGRDYKADMIADIRKVKRGDICPHCKKEKLQFSRGIEIGHTFKLGTKYSKAMGATFLSADGKENLMQMGCYGIGVSRILAAVIEQSSDENGIIWTKNTAPFEAIIIPINYAESKTKEITDSIYRELTQRGVDVLIDDREERAGIKFKDADLIGIPYRITVSEKTLLQGKVEFKERKNPKEKFELITPQEAVEKLCGRQG
ncbi:MAG: proline--tRNA ligase [Elusimicrobiota bacterium]|jgi:prolyl-tRNA synthetase|nr:proline--tRNA ligase [Elusimicrobiota bacterium]